MQHARLVIHRLHLDGVELPLRFGTLVAVARTDDDGPATDRIDWEIVADGVEQYRGELQRHHVELLCITGADDEGHLVLGELEGDAIVVRFVERTVVLRGDGPLTGLTPEVFEA
ncbi:hypothetical protein [Dermatobacter hominis]|uniref:hypothetical protein n=1 Tax=Dermatobacter hominis TaxID=2884263 RepID=UPI001D11F945|nr:hypothetical protein [Dermatobacter hominis]UDY36907.1 hypothetical protein LH044_05080 [Dermatobacter hominis]